MDTQYATRSTSHPHRASRTPRAIFWLGLTAFAALGFLGGWGRGPGLLLGAVVLASYDLIRHEHIDRVGYLLLVVAMFAVSVLWLVAGG